jgi:eukaryotic-like serine/threonine-protein kinase
MGAGGGALYRKRANGASEAEKIGQEGQLEAPLDWSPDGRFLALRQARDGAVSVISGPLAAAVAAPAKSVALLDAKSRGTQGQFSPDSKWFLFTSDESGRAEIYVRPLNGASLGSGKWQVSSAGGNYPRWAANGKEIFYIAPDQKLQAVAVKASPGQGSFDVGEPQALFQLGRTDVGLSVSARIYQVTPDAKRFLVLTNEQDGPPQPLTVVSNWLEGVKK